MGNNLNKDQKARIFVTLSKRVSMAGQNIEGQVHINCLADRPYSDLNIRIEGKEHVYWTQQRHYGKHSHTQVFQSHRDTYAQQFLLAKFPGSLRAGQYSFPFSLLLPAALPGSMTLMFDNYIKYTISAYLTPFDGSTQIQMFKRPLHIRQPPRLPPLLLSSIFRSQSNCCGCCCSCGHAEIAFQTNVANLFYLQSFSMNIRINNLSTGSTIKRIKIVLRQKLKKICQHRSRQQNDKTDYVLLTIDREIPGGQQVDFSTDVTVTKEVLGHTAIGNIISRAYFLAVVGQISCCYSDFFAEQHVVYNTSIEPPIDDQQKKIEAPVGWSPQVAAPISFLNLRPYMYAPNPMIDVRNQLGNMVPLPAMNMMSANILNPPLH